MNPITMRLILYFMFFGYIKSMNLMFKNAANVYNAGFYRHRTPPLKSQSSNLLSKQLRQKILILDGAMGTMLQSYRFDEADYRGERFKDYPIPLKGNNDLLSLTQPQAIEDIHSRYFAAGADMVETNTFSGTAIAMADYHMQDLVYEINVESARLAKSAALKYSKKTPEQPRFVAGSMGPTNRTASLSPDVNRPEYRAVTFEHLRLAYKEQAQALIDGGVDCLLIETIFDTLNAKACLFAIDEIRQARQIDIPIMVSGTITDASGRTLSGQTLEAFLISVSHIPLLSIGLNCGLGAEQLAPYIKRLADNTPYYASVHPNAGLPNTFGEYDQSPEAMVAFLKPYFAGGWLNIVGGCCGCGPEHIRQIATLASQYKPRVPGDAKTVAS